MGAAGVLACLSLVLVSSVASASGNLWVSTSGSDTANNCQTESSPCQTITWALTVAAEGDTIHVAAGTYDEQVQITRPVTILGSTGSAKTIIEPQAVPDSLPSSMWSTPPSAVAIAVAYYHDASGSMTNDIVTGINLPSDLFGCQGGQGVYVTTDSGQADTSGLTMNFDNVNNYDKNGITCDDPGTVCTIANTTVTGIGSTPDVAQNGIQIWAASGKLTLDTVTGNTFDGADFAASGVLVGNPYTLSMKRNSVTDNDSDVYVIQDQAPAWVYCGNPGTDCTNPAKAGAIFSFTHNTVSDATNVDGNPLGSGYGDGLDFDSVTETTKALSNTADNDPGIGIALYGATATLLKKDTAKSDGDGIYLGSGTASSTATANLVTKNKVGSAAIDGILADTASSGNTISGNTIHGDTSWDAQDNSTGAGTAGTANTWSSNHCSTSDPSGLCP